MNREKVINWLRENTTREQWNNRNTLFFVGVHEPFTFDWETAPYDCGIGVCVRGYGNNKNAEPIHYQDVFEQPVFIDGAEYILTTKNESVEICENCIYNLNLNRFESQNNPAFYWLGSDFGTKFTVELIPDPSAAPEAPVKPDPRLITGEGVPSNTHCGVFSKQPLPSVGPTNRQHPRNKYDREIVPGVHVDVYDVLSAFTTGSPAIDHAVKKLLAPGQRGVKDCTTDLNEAISSIQREIDRIGEWSVSEDDYQ